MEEKPILAKLIIQQCIQASLKIKEESAAIPAEFVKIGRGIVVYVCFMKNATLDTVDKMINTATSVRLSKTSDGKLVSVLDVPGSILVVPQATLGGKLKGKRMQYHGNIEKSSDLHLYESFVNGCRNLVEKHCENEAFVKSGIYGNLQVLQIDTNGPYTHTVEFT